MTEKEICTLEMGGGMREALPHTKKYRGIQGVMTGKRF